MKDIWQQFFEASDGLLKPHQADNARIHGKQIIHEMLRWTPRPPRFVVDISKYDADLAQRIIADYGLRAYNNYLSQFQEDKPEGIIPRLQIFNTCNHVIEAIQAANYNDTGKGNVEDVAEWDGDDPYDGLRYGLTAVDRYLNGVQRDAEERRKMDLVLQSLEQTKDYTAFYRKLEFIEAQSKSKLSAGRIQGPVRRRRYYNGAA